MAEHGDCPHCEAAAKLSVKEERRRVREAVMATSWSRERKEETITALFGPPSSETPKKSAASWIDLSR